MKEFTVELTEQEIENRKREWIDAQLQKYMGLSYWQLNATQNELLSEIRKKHEYSAGLYLTPEFKQALKNTLTEEVHKLVEEELKRIKPNLRQIVSQFIFDKLDTLVQETLKDAIFTTQADYNNQQQEEE